ncbi:MAG: flagellar biosynthesis anti-sigma factor FlgM [Dehalococcoidia bacterium]|nr:flagellar biosynthesis anti-sigma factor FlgM [Dehalococcoidia bacterium]
MSFETSEAVIRARKVEMLHEAVQDGSYRSDPLLTAASMMDHERN